MRSLSSIFKPYTDAIKRILHKGSKEEFGLKVNKREELITQLEKDKEVIKAAFDNDVIGLEEFITQLKTVNDNLSELKKKKDYADGIITDQQGKLLLLRRSPTNKFCSNHWCLPGGHIDPGELPEEAAKREVLEETQLQVIGTTRKVEKEIENGTIYYFYCFVDKPEEVCKQIVLDVEEHIEYKFVTPEERKSLLLIPGLEESLSIILGDITTELLSNSENIVIVRHGYTIQDKEGVNSGQDDSVLIPEGIEAAKKAADKLKELGITKLYISDVERAKETAQIIQNKIGIDITHDPDLRTWDIGDFEGQPKDSLDESYWIEHPDEKIPNGESFNEYKTRAIKAYNSIVSKDEPNIAILSHSKNMKLWRSLTKNNVWSERAKKDFLETKIENAEIEIKPPNTFGVGGVIFESFPLLTSSNFADYLSKNDKKALMLNLFSKSEISDDEYVDYIFKAADPKTKLTKLEGKDKSGVVVKRWTTKSELKQLAKHAKNASQAELEAAIKEAKHPQLREHAHKELERREQEEKPQDPKKGYEGHEYHGKEFKYNSEHDSYLDEEGNKANPQKLHEYYTQRHKEQSTQLEALKGDLEKSTKDKQALNNKLVKAYYGKIKKTRFTGDEKSAYDVAMLKLEKVGLQKEDIDHDKVKKIISKKLEKKKII